MNRFSLDDLVDEKTAPAFLWHTAEDNCVPVKNSLVYAEALAKYKIPFELHVFPYGAHGLSTCDDQSCDNINDIHKYNTVWIDNAKKWLRLIFKI